MILVTVGTSWPFERLVHAADDLAALIEEPVIIQRGATVYVPRFAQHVEAVDETQMERWLLDARVVVSHAGAGSILSILQAGRPMILTPRMAHLGEVIDDHQFELASAMADRGQAVVVTDLSAETLAAAIDESLQLDPDELGETRLCITLRDWLAEQPAEPPPWRTRLFHRFCRGGS